MKLKIIVAALSVSLVLVSNSTVAANTTNVAPDKTGAVNFRKNDDITTMISKRVNQLRSETGGRYSIASGDTEVSRDLTSETMVEEYYAAYKEAYALGIAKLIMQETRARISSELKSTTGGNLGSDKSSAQECASNYVREQDRLERERVDYERSFLGTAERILDKIFTEDDSHQKTTALDNKENDELTNYIVCEAKQNIKNLELTLGKGINGSTAGVRVMDTLVDLNNGRMAVVVGRSAETATDAGRLRAQNKVAKPLETAFSEAIKHTNVIIDSYQSMTNEPPFGILGVRGKRLSNGEMAYFGFGSAIQKEVRDEIDSTENSLAIELSQTKALAALNEFAFISASSDFSYEFDKVIEKVLKETLDMAKHGEKVDVQKLLNKELRATMSRDLSAKAKGFLENPQEMETSAWSGGESYPDFYMSVYAWSPSIMTNAAAQHVDLENAYRDGQRPDPVSSDTSGTLKAPEGVKSFKVKEDW